MDLGLHSLPGSLRRRKYGSRVPPPPPPNGPNPAIRPPRAEGSGPLQEGILLSPHKICHMADVAGPSATVRYTHKGKRAAGVSCMCFFAPPVIAVMQTGLLTAVGMQAMLTLLLPTPERSGFRAERERDGRAIPARSGTRGRSSTTDPLPTASPKPADLFRLPRAKGARGDTHLAA